MLAASGNAGHASARKTPYFKMTEGEKVSRLTKYSYFDVLP